MKERTNQREGHSLLLVKVSQEQVDHQANLANQWEEAGGSGCPGSSYEMGVKAALEWIQGYGGIPIETAPED